MKYYSVVVGDGGGHEVSNLKESRQLAQVLAEKTGKTVRILVHEGPWVAPYVLEEFKCNGYHVMKWGGGRYMSVAWYPTMKEAQEEVKRIMVLGSWSGMPPKIEPSVQVVLRGK